MSKRTPNPRTIARTRQRVHAKLRFQQRFDLHVNRDQIREIEQNIASGRAILIESKTGTVRNYFAEVDGHLLAVGYRRSTRRVVTALPIEYLAQLPPEQVETARVLLVAAAADRTIADILGGAAKRLHEKNPDVSFYALERNGVTVRVGYSTSRRKLLPYEPHRPKAERLPAHAAAIAARAGFARVLEVPDEIRAEFIRQIRACTSVFLWAESNGLKVDGKACRVGYTIGRDVLFEYRDPPEHSVELRSFMRLLDQPEALQRQVAGEVAAGRAEIVDRISNERWAVRVVYEGLEYWFEYDNASGRIGPWNAGRQGGREKSV